MSKLIIPNIDAWEKAASADDPSMDSVEFEEKQTTYSPLGSFNDDLAAFLRVCADKHQSWGKDAPKNFMAIDCPADAFNDAVQNPEIGLIGFVRHLYTEIGRMVDLMKAKHYAKPITFFIEKLDGNAGWRFIVSPHTKETTEQIVRKKQDERKAGKVEPQRITKTNLETGRVEE
jgi:hypothetical protein